MKKISVVIAFLLTIMLALVQIFSLGFSLPLYLIVLLICDIGLGIWTLFKINKYLVSIENYAVCYNFVNSFIISLSVTKSLTEAYEQCLISVTSKSIKEDLKGVEQMEVLDKVKYLKKSFNNNYYDQFLHVLNCFLNQGGDILKSSKFLLKSGQVDQQYIDGCKKNTLKKCISILVLWLLVFCLLIGLKFGVLSNFATLINSKDYMIPLTALFILIDGFCIITIKKMTFLDIPGIQNYEKVKKVFRKH